MEVDRALPEVIATGQGHVGFAATREQGAEHDDGGAHRLKEVGRRHRVQRVTLGDHDAQFVLRGYVDRAPECFEELAHHHDVADVGHVGEPVFAGREQAGGHLF